MIEAARTVFSVSSICPQRSIIPADVFCQVFSNEFCWEIDISSCEVVIAAKWFYL